jgi:hypothetical protein
MSFYSELKRRNVLNVALFYLAVGWLMLQATDVLSSLLELPIWVGKLVIFILAMGLPVALILSWLYEMTPEGLKRDSAVDPSESRRQHTVSRLNLLTIIAAGLAIVVIVADRLLPEQNAPDGQPEQVVALAVLPFVNLSTDADQEFFADGITEEILNLLANARATGNPHIVVLIQGKARRLANDRTQARCQSCCRRQRPQGRQQRAGHGAAH